jgi:hypothetical protein
MSEAPFRPVSMKIGAIWTEILRGIKPSRSQGQKPQETIETKQQQIKTNKKNKIKNTTNAYILEYETNKTNKSIAHLSYRDRIKSE